tara:strand:+ start:39697 stop:40500 length:804 start_codon:yes stop_codon:yes gene_type:complete
MRSIEKLSSMEGRVSLITGGAGHIGSAMAEALAEAGSSLVLLDLDEGRCNEAAEKLATAHNVEVMPLVVDLINEEALRAVPGLVENKFGRLDTLINCAALVGTSALEGWAVPFADQSADTWRLALETNLTSPFVLAQACAPLLAANRGAIVNIASIYGMLGPNMRLYDDAPGMGNPGAYAASKGGLIQLTRWLSTTLAPTVRVNSISLGGVWRNQDEKFVERYVDKTPLGRMATEEDLKGAALFLSSDLSLYVTGHNLVVDGGWSAW